ncbi:hypothetical protein LCGC14_0246480 [marine sediment metagenome]|uniref:Uncharacterized protein n=1 Tax=marine sediment metagenome TaxID=412755 RepID=A0A0F9UMN5_9ZZZZ
MTIIIFLLVLGGILFSIYLRFNKAKNIYDKDGKAFPYKVYASKNWDDWIKIGIGGFLGYFAIPILFYLITWIQGSPKEFILPDVQFVAEGYAIASGFLGSILFDKLFTKATEI